MADETFVVNPPKKLGRGARVRQKKLSKYDKIRKKLGKYVQRQKKSASNWYRKHARKRKKQQKVQAKRWKKSLRTRSTRSAGKVHAPKRSRLKGTRDRKAKLSYRGGSAKFNFKGLGRVGSFLGLAKKVARAARRAGAI